MAEMTRGAFIALAVLSVGLPQSATADETHLTEQQTLGRRLFEQSCGVCHTRPTMISGMYGPELSRNSAGGRDDAMRDVITNGGPRMPGFKVHFSAEQIAAIVAYLKTMPPGTQDIPAARPPARAP
jgi:mono/diheme cytochrome c family protein